MPKVSINILTKNRAEFLARALRSVAAQAFKDFELVIVNDGSSDGTRAAIDNFKSSFVNLKVIFHSSSLGISASRQEALMASAGDYIAVLDDDDEWIGTDKLAAQVNFLDFHPDYVLIGGGIKIPDKIKLRPLSDASIRRAMLFRNNFFTSTVMFRKSAAHKVGGFRNDGTDAAEDYDLWLRLGKVGKFANFAQALAVYNSSVYNKDRKKQFFAKQLRLIKEQKAVYAYYTLAAAILKLRMFL